MLRREATLLRVRAGLADVRRWLTPAPSAAWDPSVKRQASNGDKIGLTVRLPEDAILEAHGAVGATLMDALLDADLNDVWEGGACGGACQCSTCRVVIVHAPSPLVAREEEEEDMLDTAATAASRQHGEGAGDVYLADESRLACQVVLRPGDDGLVITLPEDVLNVLEVPLWLRGSR